MPRGRSSSYEHDQDEAGSRQCSRRPPELCDSARLVVQDDGTSRRDPGLTPRAFCLACETRIAGCLEELPLAYLGLAVRLGDPVRAGTPVRRPPGSRVLVNPEIDALMRTCAAILPGWAARVRSVPGLQLADPEHAHDTAEGIAEACRTLATHATPFLALQPGWTTRIYTWQPGGPMPADLEGEIGDAETTAAGDGWVKVIVQRDGAHAGNEILDLHWRARKLLGWTRPAPETFDGVPCQNCEEMGSLERAEPPSDPDTPADHSRCQVCKHTMSREVYDQWAERYASWARGAGVQVCRRCSLGLCGDCAWSACACTEGEHLRRRAVA